MFEINFESFLGEMKKPLKSSCLGSSLKWVKIACFLFSRHDQDIRRGNSPILLPFLHSAAFLMGNLSLINLYLRREETLKSAIFSSDMRNGRIFHFARPFLLLCALLFGSFIAPFGSENH